MLIDDGNKCDARRTACLGQLVLGRLCQQFGRTHRNDFVFASAAPNAEVFVFTDASQVKELYEVVGIISYDNPGKYQVLSLGDVIEPLKTKAREIGANGIIIDKSQPIKSGFISTGIYAEARAIRLKNRN